jgi:hypothetical protein
MIMHTIPLYSITKVKVEVKSICITQNFHFLILLSFNECAAKIMLFTNMQVNCEFFLCKSCTTPRAHLAFPLSLPPFCSGWGHAQA